MSPRTRNFEPDPEPWAVFQRSLPGWFNVSVGELDELYVGCVLDHAGRVVITQMFLTSPEGLDSTDLRSIPLSRLEAAINGVERRRQWVEEAAESRPFPTPLELLERAADA